MKPIILPELLDKGDSIEGIPWRQLFTWGEPRISGIGTWAGQRPAGWVYPLRLPVYPEVFLNSFTEKMEGQPCCRPVEILRETAASYAHGTAEYCTPCSLHMMRSSFVSIKRRRPHMSRAFCWRTFLLLWSYPEHFLPQTGHLWDSFLFTLAITMTEVTPSWFVSILMLLKEAVLTNRRYLRDYSA